MESLEHLFGNNRRWAADMLAQNPRFFEKLKHIQKPKYLWIGCSDSRVPANDIVGLLPGELFVHRNVANVVVHTDLNCLSVVQYAVDVLKITDIIVCGHYGCAGVMAALEKSNLGLIDNWLRHIQDVAHHHAQELGQIRDFDQKVNRLCELNALEQAINICQTSIAQEAWQRGQELRIHAWIYGLHDGLLRDLELKAACLKDVKALLSDV